MAAIFIVSSMPRAPLPRSLGDKTGHIVAYAGLAALVVRGLGGGRTARIGWITAVAAFAIAAGYGLSDELHQSFVPGRSADWYDVLADAIGATIGVSLCALWGILRVRSVH